MKKTNLAGLYNGLMFNSQKGIVVHVVSEEKVESKELLNLIARKLQNIFS